MVRNKTKDTLQYLKNESADQTVTPRIPREGMMGKASDGAWYNLRVNTDGTLSGGFSIPAYDYFSVSYPDSVTEVYTFKTGGSSGTTVATITLTYTDSTKENLSSGERS